MTTVQDLVHEARWHLQGGLIPTLNFLSASVSSSGASLTVADAPTGVAAGHVVEVGSEQMYVRNVSGSTLTVRRGHDRTTATTHAADAEVNINPLFPTNRIFDALLAELRSLNGTGLCWFETTKVTFSTTLAAYDLAEAVGSADVIDVYDVTYESNSPGQSHIRPVRYRLRRGREAYGFPSGLGLEILEGGASGYPVYVTYKRGFSDFTDLGDEPDVPDHVLPILPVGAAYRLMLSQESRRVNTATEHGSRRAEEVPVQSAAFAARAWEAQRNDLIEDALEVQIRKWPLRSSD